MDTIKFPIEYNSTGMVKLIQGSPEYYKQLLSFAALTEPGTHPLTPRFGVFDPSYQLVDRNVFMAHAARFVPEITVGLANISMNPQAERITLDVEFRIN